MATHHVRPYQRYRVTLLRDLWERAEADAQRRAPGRWVLVVPAGRWWKALPQMLRPTGALTSTSTTGQPSS